MKKKQEEQRSDDDDGSYDDLFSNVVVQSAPRGVHAGVGGRNQ
jgi:hypothetical protein